MARKNYYFNSNTNRKRNRLYAISGIIFLALIGLWIYRSGKSSTPVEIESAELQAPAQVVETPKLVIPADKTVRNVIALPGAKLDPKTDVKVEAANPIQAAVQSTSAVVELEKKTTDTPSPAVIEPSPSKPLLPANPEISQELRQIETEATELIEKKQYIAARDLLNKTLALPLTAEHRNNIKKTLESLSKLWLFSDKVLENDTICLIHKVGPGQSLAGIGDKYNIPWQFIAKINNIQNPQRLQSGVAVKAVKGPVTAVISRSTFIMDIYLQDTYIKSYNVGLGRIGQDGNPTPKGLWLVKGDGKGKLKRPPWPDPKTGVLVHYEDPKYPLGERWIGLDGIEGEAKGREGFGIHGTNAPESIGKYESDGCVRMLNDDVIEFWDMVSGGTSEIKVID